MMIPYGRQSISAQDIAAVVEVLESDWLTQGPAVERFEQRVAEYCGAAHAVAVCNGTAALHAAAYAAGLGPGRLLWTSPNTFVASANCARYLGADVDFVDIDPETWCMSVGELERKLRAAESEGRLPDVVVPVHFAGQPCDMDAIAELSGRYGFEVIEDASHAIGASYRGTVVGSCRHSAMATFSFHPVKIVTTGEGGLITTNDSELAERLRLFRSHGITRDTEAMSGPCAGPWYYEQIDLGYNYRLTDLQAALGHSQMAHLDAFVSRRNEIAARYAEALGDLPLETQVVLPGVVSSFHLMAIRVDPAVRAAAFDSLRAAGVGVNVHYIPVHLQPYYRQLGFSAGDYPVAEAYYAGALTLPLYPTLSEEDQDTVITAVHRALS